MAKGKKTGGRTKGAANVLTADLKSMIMDSLDRVGGVQYLVEQATKSPTAYMGLIAKVLPLTLAGDKDQPLELRFGWKGQE